MADYNNPSLGYSQMYAPQWSNDGLPLNTPPPSQMRYDYVGQQHAKLPNVTPLRRTNTLPSTMQQGPSPYASSPQASPLFSTKPSQPSFAAAPAMAAGLAAGPLQQRDLNTISLPPPKSSPAAKRSNKKRGSHTTPTFSANDADLRLPDAADISEEEVIRNLPEIVDDGHKPPLSYAALIGMAILKSPNRRLSLSQIYEWINSTYSWYRSKNSWQNSIRHNLSLNKAFRKQDRPKGDTGKGHYWVVDARYMVNFLSSRPVKRQTERIAAAKNGLPESSQYHNINPTNYNYQTSATANPHKPESSTDSEIDDSDDEVVQGIAPPRGHSLAPQPASATYLEPGGLKMQRSVSAFAPSTLSDDWAAIPSLAQPASALHPDQPAPTANANAKAPTPASVITSACSAESVASPRHGDPTKDYDFSRDNISPFRVHKRTHESAFGTGFSTPLKRSNTAIGLQHFDSASKHAYDEWEAERSTTSPERKHVGSVLTLLPLNSATTLPPPIRDNVDASFVTLTKSPDFARTYRRMMAAAMDDEDDDIFASPGRQADDFFVRACFGSPQKREEKRRQYYENSGVSLFDTSSVSDVFGVDVCQVVRRACNNIPNSKTYATDDEDVDEDDQDKSDSNSHSPNKTD